MIENARRQAIVVALVAVAALLAALFDKPALGLDLSGGTQLIYELDIDDLGVLEQTLSDAGVEVHGFRDWAAGEGRVLHDRTNQEAFGAGVYGVPSCRRKTACCSTSCTCTGRRRRLSSP